MALDPLTIPFLKGFFPLVEKHLGRCGRVAVKLILWLILVVIVLSLVALIPPLAVSLRNSIIGPQPKPTTDASGVPDVPPAASTTSSVPVLPQNRARNPGLNASINQRPARQKTIKRPNDSNHDPAQPGTIKKSETILPTLPEKSVDCQDPLVYIENAKGVKINNNYLTGQEGCLIKSKNGEDIAVEGNHIFNNGQKNTKPKNQQESGHPSPDQSEAAH